MKALKIITVGVMLLLLSFLQKSKFVNVGACCLVLLGHFSGDSDQDGVDTRFAVTFFLTPGKAGPAFLKLLVLHMSCRGSLSQSHQLVGR